MYTNNTITRSLARLSQAIENLEIILHDRSIPIVRYLKSNATAVFFQLQQETNLPPIQLQEQLSALERIGMIKTTTLGDVKTYELDQYKMLKIQLLTMQLIEQPIEIHDRI
jgi:predicted transcriptional regulator